MIPGETRVRAVLCADGQPRHGWAEACCLGADAATVAALDRNWTKHCGPHRLCEQVISAGPWVPVGAEKETS